MRRIDISKLSPDTVWIEKAEKAQQQIDDCAKKPADAGDIWRELKPSLKKISHKKCWYCETLETRSDDTVDHFRPKSLYPWCCCEAENFRYACTLCNSRRKDPITGKSGGKGDNFPLFSGEIAKDDTERYVEKYVLIDPCVHADVILLDFLDDGRPTPKHPDNPRKYRRATESINAYHLDHTELVERRRNLSLELKDWIRTAELNYQKLLTDDEDMTANKSFDTLIASIGKAIASEAPYSVFAKKFVRGFRNLDWIDSVVDST